jgi:hypothetical protein
MGQYTSVPTTQSKTQRIRPIPGTSGRRAKKGTISIYCENSHSIYTLNITPGMTISDIKKMLPNQNCELKVLESPLPSSSTVESLGIDNKTLLRMIVEDKSSSTNDSFHEQDIPKIGPKKQLQEKPIKPNYESVSSLIDEIPVNLKAYAVPDLKLEKNLVKPHKKPLY